MAKVSHNIYHVRVLFGNASVGNTPRQTKLSQAYLGSMCNTEQWKGGAKVLGFGMMCADWVNWLRVWHRRGRR